MRFAILHHTGSATQASHYDLLFQTAEGAGDDDRVLESYSTLKDEFPGCSGPVRVKAIAPHRRIYLQYEGPLGGARGEVTRADGGEYTLETPAEGLRRLKLSGRRLQGAFILRRGADGAWIFERDEGRAHG